MTGSAIDAEEWEWMKAYRVWEANRKIFLWPENWIEPQLRDDASPFFRAAIAADVAALQLMLRHGAQVEWTPTEVKKDAKEGAPAGGRGNANVGKTPIMVAKNSLVTVRLQNERMQLTVQGRALEDGAEGDVVRVMNTSSNTVVSAVVVDSGVVEGPRLNGTVVDRFATDNMVFSPGEFISEVSRYCTMEWMTLCGWITTCRRSGGSC